MSRDEMVREIGRPDSISYGQFHYSKFGFKVCFDRQDRCNYVEGWDPGVPTLEGIVLWGEIDHVVAALAAHGYEVRDHRPGDPSQDTTTAFCEALGIELWREDTDKPQIDSVAAWAPGFWEWFDDEARQGIIIPGAPLEELEGFRGLG